MTDNNIEITRRQILGSAGAIGFAGAGAGLGTTAYFNDEESFQNNTLTAGNFDLKVDWEEHYSYPQIYGFGDPTDGLDFDLLRENPEDPVYVGFPDPENPVVWIHEDDLDTYMRDTSIEAFPDPDGDGQQEMNEGDFCYQPCEDGADLPNHLDPEGLRTANNDTEGDGEPAPLVNLEDVKPGDFGELTLSFHLCDNPGYVWLMGDNVEEDENDIVEPEEDVDDTPNEAELAQNIQTAWWYDTNGNNVIDSSVGEVDVMIAVDTSGSLDQSDLEDLETDANNLASDLDATGNARVGGLSFGGNSIDDFTSLADGPVSFSGLTQGGNTPMPAALEIAAAELDANGRSGAETFIVMFTDGGPNYANQEYSAGGYDVGNDYDDGDDNSSVEDSELCETGEIAEGIRADHRILAVGINDDRNPTGNSDPQDCDEDNINSLSTYLRDYIAGNQADKYSADDVSGVGEIISDIFSNVASEEEVFHRGTLADDLDLLSSGEGIPLDGDLSTEFDEIDDQDDDEDRECFDPGVNYFVGFAWWLPTDVGNEVQSDSVRFDLGFYAEQCRNNGGEGDTPTSVP